MMGNQYAGMGATPAFGGGGGGPMSVNGMMPGGGMGHMSAFGNDMYGGGNFGGGGLGGRRGGFNRGARRGGMRDIGLDEGFDDEIDFGGGRGFGARRRRNPFDESDDMFGGFGDGE